MTAEVTRFVVTHIGRQGLRTIIGPAQGRFTFETEREAQEHLNAILSNNSESNLRGVYGFPLEVRPVACWPEHHDPKSVYFD